MIKPTPAFYELHHKPTGSFYGGSTAKANVRINWHRLNLLNRKHSSKRFQDIFTTWEDIEIRIFYAKSLTEAQAWESEFLRHNLGHTLNCNSQVSAATSLGFRRMDLIQPEIFVGWVAPSKRKSESFMNARERVKLLDHVVIEIDGVEYNSIAAASRSLGIGHGTITRRLASKYFSNYKRL